MASNLGDTARMPMVNTLDGTNAMTANGCE